MHDDLSRALASLRAHNDSGTSDYALLRCKQEVLELRLQRLRLVLRLPPWRIHTKSHRLRLLVVLF